MSNRTEAIEKLARDWYAALDTHEPTPTLVAMLDTADLRMVFPEATLTGVESFVGWYEGVIRIFFDEVHSVQSVTVNALRGDEADITVAVRWEASRWNPPAAKSDRIRLIAYQTWTVRFDAAGQPKIKTYTVDRLDYLPGSATL